MNPQETNALLASINSLEKIDIAKLIGETWPNQNIEGIDVGGGITATQLISLIKRITVHTKNAIDDDSLAFPRVYYHPDNLRQPVDFLSEVESLVSHASSRDWHNASTRSRLIVHGLVLAGHWSKTAKRVHAVYEKKASELLSSAEAKLAELSTTLNALRNEKDDLTKQIKECKSALDEIINALQAARSERQQLNDLLTGATAHGATIDQILSQQKTNLDTFTDELAEIKKSKAELIVRLEAASEKLTQSESRLAFMNEKADWVNELAGTAAAGVLGEKFESRKKQLASSSKWWLGGTVGALILGALWLGIAHKYFMHEGGDFWLTLALNFGLLLPAIFIVGFFAKQFGKVRQFEEEYAFRSSVAMTLGAFADRLTGSDAERNRLITETVEKLYRLPALLQEQESDGWFARRSTERMIKATTELVSAVKKPPGS